MIKKKLIEVALPLEAINRESAREKSIRHGHPSTLHLWWARRPLAACRAVLFASLVDDPSSRPEEFPTEGDQGRERTRLFGIIEDLVKWDNSNNENVLERARAEILKSTGGTPPPVLDPFCGGGSIPLEAQRLGLHAHGSDLNPVAVLITKALVEIPAHFSGHPPLNPSARLLRSSVWQGTQGIIDDVQYYGGWMRDEARKRLQRFYPTARLESGPEVPVIAWLWARTVLCPNPSCGRRMPLSSSLNLSSRAGREVSLRPIVTPTSIEFAIVRGPATESPKIGRGANFRCLGCGAVAGEEYIRGEFTSHRDDTQLLAMAVETREGRQYLSADERHVELARSARPEWRPDDPMNQDTPNLVSGRGYGFTQWSELFTERQLMSLTTLVDLLHEANSMMRQHLSSLPSNSRSDADGYVRAVCTYLAFCIDKNTLTNCKFATWQSNPDRLTQAFARQALPMSWDFAEANPLSDSGGGFALTLESVREVLQRLPAGTYSAEVRQFDALDLSAIGSKYVVATDPPYYDNIAYADLSDFFYVWLKRSLKPLYPSLFETLLVPKERELVASSHRHGGDRKAAATQFERGMTKLFQKIRDVHINDYPMNVFYAFKQAESDSEAEVPSIASTGWETMLEGLVGQGFQIVGTWPIRTELVANLKKNIGALATSVVITCRPRSNDAPSGTRREFVAALQNELPGALRDLQRSNIAPVDFAQAAIGPGMAIFSRYGKITEADGSAMRIRSALQLINQEVDDVLTHQENDYDDLTRWAIAWYEQFGMIEAPFGEAETLCRAKNIAMSQLVEAEMAVVAKGRVALVQREVVGKARPSDRISSDWARLQVLISVLRERGESSAATTMLSFRHRASNIHDLAYRLFAAAEKRGWSEEALAYNSLVVAWGEINKLAAGQDSAVTQSTLI